MTAPAWFDELKFGADGLLPVIAQDSVSGNVLMLAWADRVALQRTLETGFAHYYSRSRQGLWRKGETSGHVQAVHEVRVDCDRDSVLYRVAQTGPACHVGAPTCFWTVVAGAEGPRGNGADQAAGSPDTALREQEDPGGHLLTRLASTIARRAAQRAEGSYTVKLLDAGVPKISQKVGEEAVEVVVAANTEDGRRLASEAADLLYHLLVLLQARGVPLDAVLGELEARSKR